MTKLRLGFVTNSSSTNFVIAWKGKKEDFEDLLKEHLGLNEGNVQNKILILRIANDIITIASKRIKASQEYLKYYKERIRRINDNGIDENLKDYYEEKEKTFEKLCSQLIHKDFATNISFSTDYDDCIVSSEDISYLLNTNTDNFMFFNTTEECGCED
jgi:hypothetical protein